CNERIGAGSAGLLWTAETARTGYCRHAASAHALSCQAKNGQREGRGSSLGELRQDLLAEEPNGPQPIRLIHPGPLQAEDQRRDAETLAIAGDLLRDPRRVADDEPVARQLLEALREAFTRGQRFVL